MPAALDTDWKAIELARLSGLTFKELSNAFGISEATLRKRAQRHNWIDPNNLQQRARQEVKAVSTGSTGNATKAVTEHIVAKTWAERGEEHRAMVFEKANGALRKAKLQAPKTWKDAEIADKMARRSAGLENAEIVQQTLVNLQAISGGPRPPKPPTFDAETGETVA